MPKIIEKEMTVMDGREFRLVGRKVFDGSPQIFLHKSLESLQSVNQFRQIDRKTYFKIEEQGQAQLGVLFEPR